MYMQEEVDLFLRLLIDNFHSNEKLVRFWEENRMVKINLYLSVA